MKTSSKGTKSTNRGYRTFILSLVVKSAVVGAVATPAVVHAADSVELPRSMGALGDSMTAGALAGFKRQNSWMPWVEASFLFKILTYKMESDYSKIEFRTLSWAAGLDSGAGVVSHARRLIELQGNQASKFKVYNAAVSGNEVIDVLKEQWPRMRDWSKKNLNQNAPDYVTLLIGANDVCADTIQGMTSTDDYQQRLNDVISQIAEQSPKTHILISALPNIERLRQVAKDAPLHIPTMNKCSDVWEAINLCRTLTRLEDEGDRDVVAQRVRDYNNIIQGVVSKVNEQTGKADQVRMVASVYDREFKPDDLAMDCFHPNPNGQNLLSEETWSHSWWGSMHNKAKDDLLKKKALAAKNCSHGASRDSAMPSCK